MSRYRGIDAVDTFITWIEGNPYLTLELIVHGIEKRERFKVIFPKIDLTGISYTLKRLNPTSGQFSLNPTFLLYPEISEITLPLLPDKEGKVYKMIDLTPPKEMTMKEIEAALGYKVRVKAEEQ